MRWLVPSFRNGPVELLFEASDAGNPPARARFTWRADVVGATASNNISGRTFVVSGDVTGDGWSDVVGCAPRADVGGIADAGSIHVWTSGNLAGSPDADLIVPGAVAGDALGLANCQGLHLVDLDADGSCDIVAVARLADIGGVANTGAVYVWFGRPTWSGSLAPSVTFSVPGAATDEFLSGSRGLGVLFEDVTGDGYEDVIVGSPDAHIAGVPDTGAVYVWGGGPGLSGMLAPLATLVVPGAAANDSLGISDIQGIQLGDLTHDGIPDIVVGAQFVAPGPVLEAGAIYVWAGGAGLVGTVAPTATLVGSNTGPGTVGETYQGQEVLVVDVTGDGFLDVVAGAMQVDVDGVSSTGALYVWDGAATLAGTTPAHATLSVPGAAANDLLGRATGRPLQVCDVSGDGIDDLIVGATNADAGGFNNGAVYVWAGGSSLLTALAPTATLVGSTATGDLLGEFNDLGIVLGDVTGDGIRDVVAGTRFADSGGTSNTGALFVFAGGGALIGAPAPLATLTVPGAAGNDQLGESQDRGIQLVDLDGDGVQDVVATAQMADAGAVDTGAVYLWKGGVGLVGAQSPTASLVVPGAPALQRLGRGSGQGVQFGDVTGDGTRDVIVHAQNAAPLGVADAGAVFVWARDGEPNGTQAPTATLHLDAPSVGDQLGQVLGGQGSQLIDANEDGILDVLVGAALADVGGVSNAGYAALFLGGTSLVGSVTPSVRLLVPAAQANDRLGDVGQGHGLHVTDVTGDGTSDLVMVTRNADVGGVVDAGAIYVWPGPFDGATPSPVPSTLLLPAASPGDNLGGI